MFDSFSRNYHSDTKADNCGTYLFSKHCGIGEPGLSTVYAPGYFRFMVSEISRYNSAY